MSNKRADMSKDFEKNEDDAVEEAVESPFFDEIGNGPKPGPLDVEISSYIVDEPIHDETLAAIEEATLQKELIDGRVSTYGDPVEGHIRIAQVWSGILGIEVQPSTVPLLMMGMKAVRAVSSPDYSDHIDDIEGYSDIYRKIIGPDMIQARSVDEYLAKKREREG